MKTTPKVPTKQGRLIDGPGRGQMVDVPKGSKSYKLGPWLYKYAGEKDGIECFARWPKSRPRQRFVMQVIEMYGKHPAMMREVREPMRSEKRAAKKAKHAAR